MGAVEVDERKGERCGSFGSSLGLSLSLSSLFRRGRWIHRLASTLPTPSPVCLSPSLSLLPPPPPHDVQHLLVYDHRGAAMTYGGGGRGLCHGFMTYS